MKIKRYITLALILFRRDGWSRANYLKRIGYFGHLGENCYLQPFNYGTEPRRIFFGDNVQIASGVKFITHDIVSHVFNHIDGKRYKIIEGSIHVGSNVFIGANTVILYNVHIGDNVIIGAGAVVTKDLPDNGVYAGVPAKRIGDFESYRTKLTEKE